MELTPVKVYKAVYNIVPFLLNVYDTKRELTFIESNKNQNPEMLKRAHAYFMFSLLPVENIPPVLKKFDAGNKNEDFMHELCSGYEEIIGKTKKWKTDITQTDIIDQPNVYTYFSHFLKDLKGKAKPLTKEILTQEAMDKLSKTAALYSLTPASLDFVVDHGLEVKKLVDRIEALPLGVTGSLEVLARAFPSKNTTENMYSYDEKTRVYAFPLLGDLQFCPKSESPGYFFTTGGLKVELDNDIFIGMRWVPETYQLILQKTNELKTKDLMKKLARFSKLQE